MRLVFLALATSVSLSATPAPQAAHERDARFSAETCRDRLTEVRDAVGQPRLDRSPAAPGAALLVAAVDKRIDGCAVMQMHRRIDDLRPVPEPTVGPARLLPAR